MEPGRQLSEPRSYFAMIPRMAEKDLDPFEYRLYGHYSQVCGQDGGRCFQSVKTIHEQTRMSPTAITKARNGLQAKGYIVVVIPDGKARRNGLNTSVGIVDRWQENTEQCQQLIPYSNIKELNQSIDSIAVPVQEEPKKEEPKKEEKTTTVLPVANPEQDTPAQVVSSGGQAFQVRVVKPETQTTKPIVLPSKQERPVPARQSAPPPRVPPEPPAPTPEQQAVQAAYEKRWNIMLVGDEADKLFAMLAAHDIGYVLTRIINTNTHDDSGKPIKKPMKYMATIPERQEQKPAQKRFVSRTHLQGSDLKPAQDYPDDMQFEPPPPKADTKGAIAAWS